MCRWTKLLHHRRVQHSFATLMHDKKHTRQSRSIVFLSASCVSTSSSKPSAFCSTKSRSLYVGDNLVRSWVDARRLCVLPLRSYLAWSWSEDGSKLFITTNRMFFPPHCINTTFCQLLKLTSGQSNLTKGRTAQSTNRLFICSLKTFGLTSFKIKQFVHLFFTVLYSCTVKK